MKFGVLGPVTADRDGEPIPLAAPMVRSLLGILLMDAGRAVAEPRLTKMLWGDRPPASAKASLHNHILRLRRLLDAPERDRIRRTLDGYLIEVGPGELDLDEFTGLRRRAAESVEAGRWQAAADASSQALALWRGDPLSDVLPGVREAAGIDHLQEARLQTMEHLAQAQLRLGRFSQVVADLTPFVRQYPWRETAHGHLMHALHATGRQADALAVYQELRRNLVVELGVEPSAAVAELHQRILAADPSLLAPAPPVAVQAAVANNSAPPAVPQTGAGRGKPNQLPPRAEYFTGRAEALAILNGLLGSGDAAGTVGTSLVAVTGTAGVGKTALVVQWAAQIAARFPDGCLYVNLRGFEPGHRPAIAPEQAVRGFLHALGVAQDEIPSEPAAQTGMFRSLLAGLRLLVVLDNAHDAEQIRPLLPGAPGCLTIVTSRDRLTGLVAVNGARPLQLDLLSADEARDLLVRRLGEAVSRSAPDAVAELAELAELCARLPLALNIAAARVSMSPQLPLADFVAELRDADGRLSVLDTDDPAASVSGVFSWSYRRLSPDAARVFRLMGRYAGPDITAAATASLAALPARRVRAVMSELVGAHLVSEPATGRYTFHDLLRVYAGEQALAEEDDGRRSAAARRMLDHYLHTAHRALTLISPHHQPIELAPASPGTAPEDPGSPEQAMAWFAAEYQVLMTVGRTASEAGLTAHVWQLAWTLGPYLDRQGRHDDAIVIQLAGLDAAVRAGDRSAQARTHRIIAQTYTHLERYDEALTHATSALELSIELGEAMAQAGSHRAIAFIRVRQGDQREAFKHTRQALALFEAVGFRPGQATTLDESAYHLMQLGEHREALTLAERALAMHQEHGDRFGEASVLGNIGSIHSLLGHRDQAVDGLRRSASLFADLGAREREAEALTELGDFYRTDGDQAAARECWQQAYTILDDLGAPHAGAILARFAEPAASNTGP